MSTGSGLMPKLAPTVPEPVEITRFDSSAIKALANHVMALTRSVRDTAESLDTMGTAIIRLELSVDGLSKGLAAERAARDAAMRQSQHDFEEVTGNFPAVAENVVKHVLSAEKLAHYERIEREAAERARDLRVAKWAAYGLAIVGLATELFRAILTHHL